MTGEEKLTAYRAAALAALIQTTADADVADLVRDADMYAVAMHAQATHTDRENEKP